MWRLISSLKAILNRRRRQASVEEALRSEYLGSLAERAKRYVDVDPHGIVAPTHFASISAECARLHRDGHYYGSISLCQSVAEALVRYLCTRNGWRPAKEYETNVEKLFTRQFLPSETRDWLLDVWEKRDDYHHLNEAVEADRVALEALSRQKNRALISVESDVFAYSLVDGAISFKHPKYWDSQDNLAQVFLRLHP